MQHFKNIYMVSGYMYIIFQILSVSFLYPVRSRERIAKNADFGCHKGEHDE